MTKITDIARTEKCTLTWARIAKKSCFFVKNSNLLDDVSPLLTMIFSVTLIWILIFKLPAKMIPKIPCNISKTIQNCAQYETQITSTIQHNISTNCQN